jgi:hypothetical protein
MKYLTLLLVAAGSLLLPCTTKAQSTGRIDCARNDGYIYLYSSITTMDVRTTLQCGEVVQITGRYDTYFAARTSKGEVGYIPISNIVLLKDQPGPGLPQPSTPPPARERTPYDERPPAPVAPPTPAIPAFTLLNNTNVRVRVLKTLSSSTARTGDAVELEVLEDVFLDGVTVIARGAKATGTIAEAEPKKHFGHDGKISFNINSVRLVNNDSAPVRCFYESSGSSSNSAVSLSSGKDATIPQGLELTARIDGDVHLRRETFLAAKDTQTSTGSPNPKSHQ